MILIIWNNRLTESKAFSKFNHTNITKMYGYYDDKETGMMYLFLEYAEKGDLINVMKKFKSELSLQRIFEIFRQVANGLKYNLNYNLK